MTAVLVDQESSGIYMAHHSISATERTWLADTAGCSLEEMSFCGAICSMCWIRFLVCAMSMDCFAGYLLIFVQQHYLYDVHSCI